jgi:FKBP-type peptidyl-prolyl cis-trans isomerase SlyD
MEFIMQIKPNTVASLRYTLKNSQGELLDQADSTHPFIYLHGANNIVAGLESRLVGKQANDILQAIVPPEEGYGLRNDSLTQVIPRSMFENMDDTMLVAGAQFEAQTNAGIEVITIVSVANDTITIDANHPLAGETLHFDIEVLAVRAATAEELAHGHVHATGSSSCNSEHKAEHKHDDEGGCCSGH